MASLLKDGQTLLFIGDSITDCGRRGAERPLGNGYVKLFADMLKIRDPEKNLHIINKGIGGNRVTDLQARWSDDMLRHGPDWLSVKIGINDLHSHLSAGPNAVSPEVFEKVYEDILSRTREALPECRMLLIDPFYISTDRAPSSWRQQVLDLIPAYIEVVHKMSERYETRLVETHEMFQRLLGHYEPDEFCPEPVHPHLTGHLAIAEAVWDALSA